MIKKVLAMDPSGNFNEGKGTTGWVFAEVRDNGYINIVEIGDIKATDFETRAKYWEEHFNLIERLSPDHTIVEDYRLYNHRGARASMQSYSQMETPRLLGIIELTLELCHMDYNFQMASQMTPWTEERLVSMGVLNKVGKRYNLGNRPTNKHIRCALKHLYIWHNSEKE